MGFAVNGIRGRNNDQQIDGQNNNDNSVGGPGLTLSDPHFVDEYQIITNNFGPEYGRNSGSVVDVSTKAGTNNLHGEVYGTESNSVLDSLSNTAESVRGTDEGSPLQRRVYRRNDWRAALDGSSVFLSVVSTMKLSPNSKCLQAGS